MTITISNDYHGTKTTARVGEDGKLSKRQIYRIRRALCGMPECRCGQGPLKQLGPQELLPNGERWAAEDMGRLGVVIRIYPF
jgi:hypothetical protein